jgi:hypothetical protein
MRRFIFPPILLACLHLSGCAAVTAVSAVPGVLIEAIHTEVSSEEESFPRSIEPTVAAVQKSLQAMLLDADVLEIREDGYGIAFGNEKLKGKIVLERMTPELTTMRIQVHNGTREESIERAIIASVRANLAHTSNRQHFALNGYGRLRIKPDENTARLGWYRQKAKLDVHRDGKTDWLRLKLPSGKMAYLKSDNLAVASK